MVVLREQQGKRSSVVFSYRGRPVKQVSGRKQSPQDPCQRFTLHIAIQKLMELFGPSD